MEVRLGWLTAAIFHASPRSPFLSGFFSFAPFSRNFSEKRGFLDFSQNFWFFEENLHFLQTKSGASPGGVRGSPGESGGSPGESGGVRGKSGGVRGSPGGESGGSPGQSGAVRGSPLALRIFFFRGKSRKRPEQRQNGKNAQGLDKTASRRRI